MTSRRQYKDLTRQHKIWQVNIIIRQLGTEICYQNIKFYFIFAMKYRICAFLIWIDTRTLYHTPFITHPLSHPFITHPLSHPFITPPFGPPLYFSCGLPRGFFFSFFFNLNAYDTNVINGDKIGRFRVFYKNK